MKQILTIIAMSLIISCQSKTDFYTLTNKNGCQAVFTPYGARLVSLTVPDKNGTMTGIVIGLDSVSQYASPSGAYYGATIGRYGNRIAKGRFELDGKSYQISINDGVNALHGGKNGFNSKDWHAQKKNDHAMAFEYFSNDGEEGFPGDLSVEVDYYLTDKNELIIEYKATSDQPTVINLTNHAFFNLNGEGSGSILGHLLKINADEYTPVDSALIPTGKIDSVKGTVFDFTIVKSIGRDITGLGYDHNFVLNGTGMKLAATAIGDQSGIKMEVYTDQPGLQFYSDNFGTGKNQMRKGRDDFRSSFCLETQHFPDSPNQPGFPSTVLKPREQFHSVSIYKFSY